MSFMGPDGQPVNEIKKVRYTHDAMVDQIIANPSISQNELAFVFDRTPAWISIIVNSDSFKERLAERKDEVVDPLLRTTLEERIRGVVDLSLEVLQEKLRATKNPNIAIRVMEHGTRALGYGARQSVSPTQVNTYVAVVPARELSAEAWAASHTPKVVVEQVLK
jgi:hypothetical protein